ncbi:thioredoxin [Snodgrassella sp. B3882]|uniref:thioredoxin n=1 Tax=Snodgrassella sp. B3882 TaxID=2818037 RepID=UPI0022698638|nr:thioredoxin [Snodgrassella sp. B3882]MCX8745026.1 thioredoxin [Snodgrassella sp. B3882]
MSNDLILNVSDADFDKEVIQSSVPVLVDFWASWCSPCKMIAPILESLAPEYCDRLKIVKVNVEDNSQTPAKFGIRQIPTLIIIKNGQVVATKVGTLSKGQLEAFINASI